MDGEIGQQGQAGQQGQPFGGEPPQAIESGIGGAGEPIGGESASEIGGRTSPAVQPTSGGIGGGTGPAAQPPGTAPAEGGMKKKKKKGLILGAALGCVCTVILLAAGIALACHFTGSKIIIARGMASAGGEPVLTTDAVAKVNELEAYIDHYYYGETDADAIRDGMYEGLLSGLGDRYSVYYNPQDYKDMRVGMTGQYCGIGAALQQDPDTMQVTAQKIYEGTPSEKAGIEEGDVIVSVDGVDSTTMDVTDLVQLIRGEEGTTVRIEVYRPSTGESLSLDVERANVTLPSVASQMLDDGIGYIQIESFETDTAQQFEEALSGLEGDGMESLIVDLRYNSGGLVDSAVKILDDILPEGLIVYTEDKDGRRQEYGSDAEHFLDCPMAVLVNEESASASEIFAGAVKDYGCGTLIGTKTFGKGIVQTLYSLSDGDALKLTTARYFTPKGNYIHGVGIEPDITLEYEFLNPDAKEYDIKYDNQVQKAIEVLQGG